MSLDVSSRCTLLPLALGRISTPALRFQSRLNDSDAQYALQQAEKQERELAGYANLVKKRIPPDVLRAFNSADGLPPPSYRINRKADAPLSLSKVPGAIPTWKTFFEPSRWTECPPQPTESSIDPPTETPTKPDTSNPLARRLLGLVGTLASVGLIVGVARAPEIPTSHRWAIGGGIASVPVVTLVGSKMSKNPGE